MSRNFTLNFETPDELIANLFRIQQINEIHRLVINLGPPGIKYNGKWSKGYGQAVNALMEISSIPVEIIKIEGYIENSLQTEALDSYLDGYLRKNSLDNLHTIGSFPLGKLTSIFNNPGKIKSLSFLLAENRVEGFSDFMLESVKRNFMIPVLEVINQSDLNRIVFENFTNVINLALVSWNSPIDREILDKILSNSNLRDLELTFFQFSNENQNYEQSMILRNTTLKKLILNNFEVISDDDFNRFMLALSENQGIEDLEIEIHNRKTLGSYVGLQYLIENNPRIRNLKLDLRFSSNLDLRPLITSFSNNNGIENLVLLLNDGLNEELTSLLFKSLILNNNIKSLNPGFLTVTELNREILEQYFYQNFQLETFYHRLTNEPESNNLLLRVLRFSKIKCLHLLYLYDSIIDELIMLIRENLNINELDLGGIPPIPEDRLINLIKNLLNDGIRFLSISRLRNFYDPVMNIILDSLIKGNGLLVFSLRFEEERNRPLSIEVQRLIAINNQRYQMSQKLYSGFQSKMKGQGQIKN